MFFVTESEFFVLLASFDIVLVEAEDSEENNTYADGYADGCGKGIGEGALQG